MTTIEQIKHALREHIALAEKATPGPWEASQYDDYGHDFKRPVRVKSGDYDVARNGTPGCFLKDTDAAFIAQARTMSPAACKALLTAIEGLEILLRPGSSMPMDEGGGFATEYCQDILNQIAAEWS